MERVCKAICGSCAQFMLDIAQPATNLQQQPGKKLKRELSWTLNVERCFGRKRCQLLMLQRLLYWDTAGGNGQATKRLQHNTHMEEKLCQFVCCFVAFVAAGKGKRQATKRQATRSVYMAALLMMTEMCRCRKSIFYAQLCHKCIWSRSLSCHEPPIGSRVKVRPQVHRSAREHAFRDHTGNTHDQNGSIQKQCSYNNMFSVFTNYQFQ